MDRRGQAGFTLVELLVVVAVTSVIATAITSVVISSFRIEQNQQSFQDVIDDGRIAMQRVRGELRSARRVHEDSDARTLRMWVDADQDQAISDSEQICFVVEPFGGSGEQWQLVRWTHAATADDCAPGITPPAGGERRVVARTLTDPEVFAYDPPPAADPLAAPTREVDLRLVLEVVGARNLSETTVRGSIRLRNVP